MPVVTTIMGKGAISTTHKLYVGNIDIHGSYAANSAISQCDVLFSIGTRFNDRITGVIEKFAANATIIHIDIDAASISRNIAVDIPIVADAKNAICALIKKVSHLDIEEWVTQIHGWKEQYPLTMKESGITPKMIIEAINGNFEKVIITTDVGQNQLWATQFLDLNQQKQMLTSGGLGTMGYGFPAAIGAAAQNLLLEATYLELGGVWFGVATADAVVENVRTLFSLPDNIKPFALISVGYPDGQKNEFIDRYKAEKVHYEKWL